MSSKETSLKEGGNGLPSWEVVLKRHFKLRKVEKLNVRSAVTQAVLEAMLIWERARIPTTEKRNVIVKLEKKWDEYRSIGRGRTRRTASQIQMEEEFQALDTYLTLPTSRHFS